MRLRTPAQFAMVLMLLTAGRMQAETPTSSPLSSQDTHAAAGERRLTPDRVPLLWEVVEPKDRAQPRRDDMPAKDETPKPQVQFETVFVEPAEEPRTDQAADAASRRMSGGTRFSPPRVDSPADLASEQTVEIQLAQDGDDVGRSDKNEPGKLSDYLDEFQELDDGLEQPAPAEPDRTAQPPRRNQPSPRMRRDVPVQPDETRQTAGAEILDWSTRVGPAYPGDVWRSIKVEVRDFGPMVWDDTKSILNEPASIVMLAMAPASLFTKDNNGDDQIASHFFEHGNPLGGWDVVGDVGGSPALHFGIAGMMYVISAHNGDTRTNEISKTMLSALTINGVTTLGLKAAVNYESPNGEEMGWPSGHTSSSFCMATVAHEAYGPWVGIPAFAFASFVGFERVAARNHNFSDVIGGALIGMAIGHAVASNHQPKFLTMDVLPYTPRDSGFGIALYKRW